MKKQTGFIATSLLYTFFLAFITLFIGMITIYLQNRVYLNKLEDSSKNAIYIREIRETLKTTSLSISINGTQSTFTTSSDSNIFTNINGEEYNFARCELIYREGYIYYLEGCPTS